MNAKRLLPAIVLGLSMLFIACSKEEAKEAPAYVGDWETAAFEFQPGVNVIMSFTFTETTFETIVNPAGASIPLLGVKGTVKQTDVPGVLEISMTDIGQVNLTGGIDWVNRNDSPEQFNGIYESTIGGLMPKDFDTEYTVEGNDMELYIPDAEDTIYLTKK